MKPLLKIMLVLAILFAATFIVIRLTGAFSVEDVTQWLEEAKTINPVYVFLLVVLILAVDIFIAVPTLTTCILAGYFLGFPLGGVSALVGMMLAGAVGYWFSFFYGDKILKFIIHSEEKREEAKSTFQQYGLGMIILSRSSPIFSEVCACMAGMTKMKLSKFYLAWSVNTVPYALIAAYSGSISTLENPKPAIYAIIGMYVVLWLTWFVFKRYKNIIGQNIAK